MRLTARIALAAVLLATGSPASAVAVRGLYEASVPVADQSTAARDPALRQALQAVLVRVTGSRHLPEPAASSVLARAGVLVQGYGYEAAPVGKDLLLRARFDARAVEAALRSQGLPVWGSNRLSHVVWLALRDDGAPRGVVDAASAPTRAGALLAAAEARGVPLTFPSLDATDRQLVTFNELWSGVLHGAQGASRRYAGDVIFVGRVGREGGRWVGRWTVLNSAGASEEWASTHDTVEHALAAGVHELADREAQRFAYQTGGETRELRLQVGGVQSLHDYGRALNYLRGMSRVRSAQVESAEDGVLTIRIRIDGDAEGLARAIGAGGVLRRDEGGLFGGAQSYVLVR